ncbi:hypothetical protein [Rhizobacter sp. OV335]|uniref:hypothetical protein n=1 Tax=Rhizobacter sp. OV335 TaxID=1500264 RepID=UPI0009198C5E|nr:hypothetical protein [Rhizobacter sp. OV335]SHN38400.1 hypothetical protein SAMN02787076_05903 [Rhizobacter sp. OV335]
MTSTPPSSTPAARRDAMRWVPVPEELFQATLKVRVQVQKQLQMRPDLSVVIGAMLARALETEGLADAVTRHAVAQLQRNVEAPVEP